MNKYLGLNSFSAGFLLLLTLSTQVFSASQPDNFRNPIISGFYPDPSITRVDDTYYITNSSFEWFPALPIHKSKDLVNWEKIGYGISEPKKLPLHAGLRDSLGIFAPTLRFYKGKFYIITTCVGCGGNFIVTATNPEGPWSEPIWIKGAVGIDPSLYWENDKAYYIGAGLLNKEDQKKWPGINGIWMQEINTDTGALLGEAKQLTHGHASNARWAEGPHLYKIDGEYLLLIGEGGTNEFHAVTVFNSKKLWGPYTPNHANPVLTHRHLGGNYPIDQTGHADLVQTSAGDWWSVLLAKRQIQGQTLLARETFLAKVVMKQNESGITPVYNPGLGLVQVEQKRPDLPWSPVQQAEVRDNFSDSGLSLDWNTLRTPVSSWHKVDDGKLYIDLRKQKLEELENPSFIGKRFKHHRFNASAKLSFSTNKSNEKAGLALYRRSTNHYQLLKQEDSIVLIKTSKFGPNGELKTSEIARKKYKDNEVVFHVSVIDNIAQFSYGKSKKRLKKIGKQQDLSILSDEYTQRFNGNYIGMYATSDGQDSKAKAVFDWFDYLAK